MKQKPPSSHPTTGKSRQERIAIAAYLRALNRHFAPGHEHADWLAAEAEVDGEIARETTPAAAAAKAAPPAPNAGAQAAPPAAKTAPATAAAPAAPKSAAASIKPAGESKPLAAIKPVASTPAEVPATSNPKPKRAPRKKPSSPT